VQQTDPNNLNVARIVAGSELDHGNERTLKSTEDSAASFTAAVAYRVENGSSVLYASETLAAAFVHATAVAKELGHLVKVSDIPTVSVQV
jgi:hypothetical protein